MIESNRNLRNIIRRPVVMYGCVSMQQGLRFEPSCQRLTKIARTNSLHGTITIFVHLAPVERFESYRIIWTGGEVNRYRGG